ncbi:MAG TPA: hypothetical protein VGJ02_10500 [Pyrinomonadaceae bacterium]
MLGNIFHNEDAPAERPLDLTGIKPEGPITIVRRRARREPPIQPGDEIYDRARIIFSRARRAPVTGRSGAF